MRRMSSRRPICRLTNRSARSRAFSCMFSLHSGCSSGAAATDQTLCRDLVGDQAGDHTGPEHGVDGGDLARAACDSDDLLSPEVVELEPDRAVVEVDVERAPVAVQELAQHLAHGPGLVQTPEIVLADRAREAQEGIAAELADADEAELGAARQLEHIPQA